VTTAIAPERPEVVRLGLRENAAQFTLLVVINAFVGAMIGMERSILPPLAEREFHLVARTAILSFIVVFGLSKAITNYIAGRLADRLGRKHVLVAGWLVGVDLSSAHVAVASRETSRRGRSDATRFVHGDFLDVAGQLPSADIVTLDRVVSYYPEYERFLEESLRHTGRIFALSYTLDFWYVRTWVGIQNSGRAITRNAFRSFIHPVSAMENVIRRERFTLLNRQSTRTWRADVYARS
jgi:hypothetical protein